MKRILFLTILLISSLGFSQVNGSKSARVFVGTEEVGTAPQITSSVTDNITTSGWRVSWSVSPNATGQIEFYKTSEPETRYYTILASSPAPNHVQSPGQLVGGVPNGASIEPNTTYAYREIGEDADENGYQGEWKFVNTLSETPTVTIVATDNTAEEAGETTGTFTVTMSSPSVGTTPVNYSVGGTATPTNDYDALSGVVNITDGNTSATITVNPVDDAIEDEGNETVILTLLSGSYTIGTPSSATVTIIDDDSSGGGFPAPDEPTMTPPSITDTYTPTSAADIQNAANANKRAIITNSFDCTGCTFAADQTIQPNGGAITGTGIVLNGAYIEENGEQAFAPTARVSEVYDGTRVSPELFGADSGDATADDAAIDALIINCKFGTGTPAGVYIKNQEVTYNRSGDFNWNMNGSILRTTSAASLSHGPEVNNQNTYMFMFDGMDDVTIFGGEFDGQDLASRLFKLDDLESYYFTDLYVHNYYAPPGAYARGVAFRFYITDRFTGGYLYNSTIEHIGAASNGNANDAPYGVSKALYHSVETNNLSNQYFSGLIVNDIYGDDAEGFYNARSGSYNYATNQTNFFFDNVTFTACQRRAFKINASNVHITNSTITSATNDWIFSGAQATLIHVFSITNGQAVENVVITGNNVSVIGDAKNALFGINDANDVLVENNTFSANYLGAQRSITFGVGSTQGGLYSGDLSDTVIFRNNETTNVYFGISNIYVPINGGMVFESNDSHFDVDRNMGIYWAAIRLIASTGTSQPLTLTDWSITVNQTFSTGALFGGVFNTQGMEPNGLTFDNVDIDYTGSTNFPTYAFAYTGKNDTSADFDSSNTIVDCNITGRSGTGAVFVKGSDKSVVITTSFGDGATPITTN